MALKDTDLFLISRDGTDYKTRYEALIRSLNQDLDTIHGDEVVTMIDNVLIGKNPDGTNPGNPKGYIKEGDNVSLLNNDGNGQVGERFVVDAPSNGSQYVRNNASWEKVDISGEVNQLENDLTKYIDDNDDINETAINDLAEVVGKLKLKDLKDTDIPTPASGHQLIYRNNKWVAEPNAFANQSIKFTGIVDVSDPSQLPSNPSDGDVYLQHSDLVEVVTADDVWTGIEGELVNEGQYVLYGSGQWHKGKTIENVIQLNSDFDELDTNSPSYIVSREKLVTKDDYITSLTDLSLAPIVGAP